MSVELKAKATDNHGNKYIATIEQKDIGVVLVLEEESGKTSGKWSWYLSTLFGICKYSRNRIGDELALDDGQNWTVTGMKAILDEAKDLVTITLLEE